MFKDRADAGRRLAERLAEEYSQSDAIILGIPRGGVVVANEVAQALGLQLDIIIPRKIGAPGNPELAIGAVAQGKTIINRRLADDLGISDTYIEEEAKRQIGEIERRRTMYLGDRQPLPLEGKKVIIVDDGLATGYTALAAVDAVKLHTPEKVVLAVPVAPSETYLRLQKEVDQIVCLQVPDLFMAVGQFYDEFEQTSDLQVVEILKNSKRDWSI